MRSLCLLASLLVLGGCQRIDPDKAASLDTQPGEGVGQPAGGPEVYAESDSLNAPGAPNNIATPDATTPPPPPNVNTAKTADARAPGDPAPRPDNTAVNERDRAPSAKTPLDQGENAADRKTTAEIRQRIVNADNMSINARNVKIITSDGRVTLRGPVNSAAEHDAIVQFAREIAGESNVDDQLEVAAENAANSAANTNP